MNVRKKINKRFAIFRQISVWKTLYFWIRIKHPRNCRFHIYPSSIVKIDKSAKLEFKNGELKINASWSPGRTRRNISEFIMCKKSQLVIEDDFSLYQGASIHLAPNAKMLIKGQSFANTNTQINCFNYIEIGKGTYISDDVRIQDSDNHYIIENGVRKLNSAPIIIGDHVWIGKNALILKGVTIGEGAIVAAGSIVVKDVPAKSLVAGNPARVIKENVIWE